MRQLIAAGLRRLAPQAGTTAGPYDAQVIAVCTSKGGVGKTTTAVHLAAGLAREQRRRTLLVDLDPQGHVGASLRSLTPLRSGELAGVLTSTERREVMEAAVPTQVPDLHITVPDKGLGEADKALTARIGREFLLRRALKLTRTHYEHIVLDCPPNLGNLTLNALLAADALIIPCEPSVLSLQGVEDLLAAVGTIDEQLGHRPRLLGVLRTRVDRRNKKVHESVGASLERAYGSAMFRTQIGVNTALAKAQLAGTTVWDLAPDSSGAADYGALVDEVLERLEGRVRPN